MNGEIGCRTTPERVLNCVVQPLLTDLYQITMAYAYWKSGKSEEMAVFDLFFRKNPFQGEFTVFAGLEDCLKLLDDFNYSDEDLEYLRRILPANTEPEFFHYLRHLNTADVTLFAIAEGSVVFPKVPLMRVEGPLLLVQLLETTLLNLVNYASLLATNSVRYRIAAGPNVSLFEFGLRRAQGPDGGLSASRYAYMGGFDGTSNVLAGKLYDIPVKGTHAHAFVMSYASLAELPTKMLKHKQTGEEMDFVARCLHWQEELSVQLNTIRDEVNEGELAAFIAYASAFPSGLLALVDTYDVVRSGLLNFCSVAMALNDLGYRALGVRIDSGDLAYLSRVSYDTFTKIASEQKLPWFKCLSIIASNDINEETIYSLAEQGHRVTCFGIGTHLVTCQRQPALGCVYKLVQVKGRSCIKLSLDLEKVTIPGPKCVYRLYGQDGMALLDLLTTREEEAPEPGHRVLCRHPFQESKRAYVTPSRVVNLLVARWSKGRAQQPPMPSLAQTKGYLVDSLKGIRSDTRRHLNPTPYKVSVSAKLYQFMHDLWLQNAPIGELS